MKNRTRALKVVAWISLGLLIVGVAALLTGFRALGKRASGERLERIQKSEHWDSAAKIFKDVMPRHESSMWRMAKDFYTSGSKHRSPKAPLPIIMRKKSDFDTPPTTGLRITWLGHSTLIIEIDGYRILVDPVWGERASPYTWMGPKRFHRPPLPFEELPKIDAIIISHDHYDHLDYPTILQLVDHHAPFLVPLGVGAHLAYWGVAEKRIYEFEWWQNHTLTKKGAEPLTLTSTPARHFSGRSLNDRDKTLWCGWALVGAEHRTYYSGDTAMFPGFKEIGDKLGPFDATMIESGAYNPLWADVHIGPEQAVDAHILLRGKTLIPVHWGTFDLALHGWTEPGERILVAAEEKSVEVSTPKIGQSIDVGTSAKKTERWWPEVPWQTAEEAPQVSSGL